MKDESMRSNSESSVGHVESQFIFWHGCASSKLKKQAQTIHWEYIYWGIHTYAYTHIQMIHAYMHSTCAHMHAYTCIYIYVVQIKFCLCALNTCTHRQTHQHNHASILEIRFCLGTTEQSNLDCWNKSSNFSQIAKIHACVITLLWDQLPYVDVFKIWNKTPNRFDQLRYVCLMQSFLLFASLWICW